MLTLLFLFASFSRDLIYGLFWFCKACFNCLFLSNLYHPDLLLYKHPHYELTVIMSRVVLLSTILYNSYKYLSLILTLLISFLAHCLVFILASFFIVCLISQLFIIRMGQLTLLGVVTNSLLSDSTFFCTLFSNFIIYQTTFVVYPLRSTVY